MGGIGFWGGQPFQLPIFQLFVILYAWRIPSGEKGPAAYPCLEKRCDGGRRAFRADDC